MIERDVDDLDRIGCEINNYDDQVPVMDYTDEDIPTGVAAAGNHPPDVLVSI